jgi:hypothetical protein
MIRFELKSSLRAVVSRLLSTTHDARPKLKLQVVMITCYVEAGKR